MDGNSQHSRLSDFQRQSAIVAAAICGACLLGATVAAGGNDSAVLLTGAAVLGALLLSAAFVLEVPMISTVRTVFVASFFFKADINLFRLNDIADPSGLNISLTFAAAVVLIVYDQFSERRSKPVFTIGFSILLLALFFAAVVSVIFGDAGILGWYSIWSFFSSIVIAFCIASHFSDRDRLTQLVSGLAAGVLVTGLTSMSQYLFEFPMNLDFFGTGTKGELAGTQSEELSRVPAFLRTPTEMAWVLSSVLPLIAAPLICRERATAFWQKSLMTVAIVVGVVAIVLSLARGSWIGIIVTVPIVFGLGWLRLSASEKRNYLLTTVAAAVLGAIALVPLAPRIYERLTGDDSGSAMIRVPLMETAVRMIEDNAFVGVGLNGYRENMGRYDETQMFVSRVFPNPVHNVFAHVTAEIGVPGGIVFVLLVMAALFESLRALASRDRLVFAVALGVTAGLVAFIISAVKEPGSLGSVRPGIRTLFFLFGVALAVSRIRRMTSSVSYGN